MLLHHRSLTDGHPGIIAAYQQVIYSGSYL